MNACSTELRSIVDCWAKMVRDGGRGRERVRVESWKALGGSGSERRTEIRGDAEDEGRTLALMILCPSARRKLPKYTLPPRYRCTFPLSSPANRSDDEIVSFPFPIAISPGNIFEATAKSKGLPASFSLSRSNIAFFMLPKTPDPGPPGAATAIVDDAGTRTGRQGSSFMRDAAKEERVGSGECWRGCQERWERQAWSGREKVGMGESPL